MELWFTEKQLTEGEEGATVCLSVRIKEVLHREKTPYQEIAVFDTYEFGRMLVLDDIIQLTESDEFIYHEMLAHVPLCTHPNPERVLVVGGGDGGTVREICKHPSVRQIGMAELDQRVVEASRTFLPALSAGFGDPRVEINFIDGTEYIRTKNDSFDVVIVDSPDPLGPAEVLFGSDFYRSVFTALKQDGIMAVQSESPVLNRQFVRKISNRIKEIFPGFYYCLAPVPTYPGGLWSFAIGSKRYNPAEPGNSFIPGETRYYTPAIHQSAFTLPPFIREIIE